MTTDTSRLGAVLVALTVLMAAATGAVAGDYTAPPSPDQSGTDDTTTTTDLAPGENRTYNESHNETIQWLSDSNSTKVTIARNDSDHTSYANGSAAVVVWNSTDADGHYNVTFAHTAVADTEHAINSNVTMNVSLVDNASLDEANQSVGYFDWYLEFGNATTTEVIDNSDVSSENIVTVTNESASEVVGLSLPFTGEDNSDIETERKVNGSTTDVQVVFSNATVADDFTSVASDASSGDKLSGLFSLERTAVLVQDGDGTTTAVPVYSESAPDSVSEDDTYAVQTTVGGTDALEVNLGSEFDDASSVTVHAVGSAGLGTFAVDYLTQGISNSFGMTLGGGAFVLGVPLFVAWGREEDELEV